MHVRADGRDRRTLPGSQILRQQRGSRALTSVLAQSHHLAVHNVRQHGPESLAFASLDLVESDVTWVAASSVAHPTRRETASPLGGPWPS